MTLSENMFLTAIGLALMFVLGAILCNIILNKLFRRRNAKKGQKQR